MSTPSLSVRTAREAPSERAASARRGVTSVTSSGRRSDVGDLAALVLEEQLGALRVGDDLRLVRTAVDDLAVLDGLDQRGGFGLPLRATRARVGTGDLPLRGVTCHG